MSNIPVPASIQFIPPSEWAVCLHEAGHAAAAIIVQQIPAVMEIIGGPPPYGRNSIPRVSGSARRIIAVGGYVVELALFKAGRLVDAAGNPVITKDFIDQAAGRNASQDKAAFFEEDRSDKDGFWSAADDNAFMGLADQLHADFPMSRVEALAGALMAERCLTTDRIVEIWNGA